jgi:hypothetical protein
MPPFAYRVALDTWGIRDGALGIVMFVLFCQFKAVRNAMVPQEQ